MDTEHEAAIAALEATGDYRVLRRIKPREAFHEADGSETRVGIVVDLETTGLDPNRDEIIEIGMVAFTYSPDGRIFDVRCHAPFSSLRQPSIPISAEITAITGLDDAAVAGHAIDPAAVAAFADEAVLIIAHRAAFDRPFLERFCPPLRDKCWACSATEINWRAEGIDTAKLSALLGDLGFFYDRHRAVNDCLALVELLGSRLPRSGGLALSKLLEAARQPTWRIWAIDSPFPAKDTLKARGYRWNPGDDGRPKSWYVDLRPDALDAEREFLNGLYKHEVNLPMDKLTAYERFSE